MGQALGGMGGMILGQVLIPVPILGGIIGGMIGGIVGAKLGDLFGKAPVLGAVNDGIRRGLAGLARALFGSGEPPDPGRARPPELLSVRADGVRTDRESADAAGTTAYRAD